MSLPAKSRRLVTLAGWFLAGLTGAALLLLVVALALGDRAVVVLSGSMEPALSPGDVLIERSVEPRGVEVGQIVTFHDPGSDRMLTHRVRRIEARGAKLMFVTKGDADNGIQRWTIDRDDSLGQPVLRVPAIGRLAMLAKTPLGLFGVVLLPLLLIAGWEIRRIWRPAAKGLSGAPGARA